MKTKQVGIIAACFLLFTYPILAGELLILTENLPPLNYVDNGVLVGPAVEIVKEIQRRIGSKEKIHVFPWARAYQTALEEKNIILFCMARTKVREDKFIWIGQVARKRDILVAKRGSEIKINSLENAKKVAHIGTLRDDAKEIYLKNNGFTNLVPTHDDQRNAKKLIIGRIDLWATKKPGLLTICKLAGVDYHDIEEVYSIRESSISIAASKKTSVEIIEKWRAAFNKMIADGTIFKIKNDWNIKLDDDPFPELSN